MCREYMMRNGINKYNLRITAWGTALSEGQILWLWKIKVLHSLSYGYTQIPFAQASCILNPTIRVLSSAVILQNYLDNISNLFFASNGLCFRSYIDDAPR